MSDIQALILGLIQGLTEFLPVSSSGHLEIGHRLLGINTADNLMFAVVVHVATVLSTLIVFRKDILILLKDLFKIQWNESTRYVCMLLFSSVPVVLLGLFFASEVGNLFTGNLLLVGSMLLITATLLIFAHFSKQGVGKVTFGRAFIIGLAQAIAVLPGISRSGATIATGLLIKTNKDEVARFSFLMVMIPIIGAVILDMLGKDFSEEMVLGSRPLIIGFLASFVSGLMACSMMIRVVRKGKLIYFAIYCCVIGLIAIFAA